MQHLMSSGSPGHLFEMYAPPPFVQDLVEIQTPCTPSFPVHGPFLWEAALTTATAARKSEAKRETRMMPVERTIRFPSESVRGEFPCAMQCH